MNIVDVLSHPKPENNKEPKKHWKGKEAQKKIVKAGAVKGC
jgi:hypothetical protein